MSLTDKISSAAGWCKSQFMYYVVYTPEDRAMLNKVREARKSGKLEQFKPLQKYSDAYWRFMNSMAQAEDSKEDKFQD